MNQDKMASSLAQKIKTSSASVAVIGQGYVGLPLALAIHKAGFFVWGIDSDRKKITALKTGRSYIDDVRNEDVTSALKTKKFIPTSSFAPLSKADIAIIAVPTPLDKYKIPDLSAVKSASAEIARRIHAEELIILESTTYPGTTEEILLPILSKRKIAGKWYLAFSPERVDPGNKQFTITNTPKVVGGVDAQSTKIAALFYGKIIERVVPVSSARSAEMTKLLENIFRIVNISLVNELALLSGKMGVDIWEVIDAASTKPYGFMPFYPGPGIGGHCFEKNHIIFIKQNETYEAMPIGDVYKKFHAQKSAIDVLSYNTKTQKTQFNKAKIFTKRGVESIYIIKTHYNHTLRVTDKHPVITASSDGSLAIKFAKDMRIGDWLIFAARLPENVQKKRELNLIDVCISHLPNDLAKIRVHPQTESVKAIRGIIKPLVKNETRYFEYIRRNFIPLSLYAKIKNQITWDVNHLELSTGKGPSHQKLNAVLDLDESFCRFLGYYLSEGCITTEQKTSRIRLTFNTSEKEYIDDVKQILDKKQIPFSTYKDKRWNSFHIKISSAILSAALRYELLCGTNCYNMQIPWRLFLSDGRRRAQILTGLLRGDGGVSATNKMHSYYNKERTKRYAHKNNTVTVSFFSSSPVLFQQTQLLLREQGIMNGLDKRAGYLTIKQVDGFKKARSFFLGEKLGKLNNYFNSKNKEPRFNYCETTRNFIKVQVKSVRCSKQPRDVYSLEVEPAHTIITDGGIIAHNCIAVDPFYLSYKAREYGFFTRFIDLAGEINELMPHYVVTKVDAALNYSAKKSINGSQILLLGVSYKKNIKDTRESAAYEIAEALYKKGARLAYHDSYIEQFKTASAGTIKKIPALSKSLLAKYDAVVIITDHENVDYEQLARFSRIVIDTRNAIKIQNLSHIYRL